METLDKKYAIELDALKGTIQSSDLLATYLETEEEEDYLALRSEFEPAIESIYQRIAAENPLQLISLEKKLLDPDFEGLYLTKILGYSVLRGEIDNQYRYRRPQNHFKDVLMAICHSSNFEFIKMRIGQGIQIGFALSSEIWTTNLVEQVRMRRARQFLEAQIIEKYREVQERETGYERYARQFVHDNFRSAEFPATMNELKLLFPSLKSFLLYRAQIKANNQSLLPNIQEFLNNKEFMQTPEYVEMLNIFANYYEHGDLESWLSDILNKARKETPAFNETYFEFHEELLRDDDIYPQKDEDLRVANLIDMSQKDDLAKYYQLMSTIHTKGYIHEDTIQETRKFYDGHEGLSTINECLRRSIYRHFYRLLTNLPEEDYNAYFELHKVFSTYMQLFNNQQFNQDLKELNLNYVRKLLKKFTDKRGKDYQDIKRHVTNSFLEFGFMNEKQITELFKTRRKKKVS